jgi:hypothetical protein
MQENGLSRIYGGWHYSFDNTAALEMGAEVGNTIFADAFTAVPEPPSYALLAAGVVGLIVSCVACGFRRKAASPPGWKSLV